MSHKSHTSKSPLRRLPNEPEDRYQRRITKLLRDADSTIQTTLISQGLKKLTHADRFLFDMQYLCKVRLEKNEIWRLIGPIDKPGNKPWFKLSMNNAKGWRKAVVLNRTMTHGWSPEWGEKRVFLNGMRVMAWYLIGAPQLYDLIPVHVNAKAFDGMAKPEFEWISKTRRYQLTVMQRRDVALEMREDGKTLEEIAKHLGVSRQTVVGCLPKHMKKDNRYPVKLHRPEDRKKVMASKRAVIERQLIRDGRSDVLEDEQSVMTGIERTSKDMIFKPAKEYHSKSIATFAKDRKVENEKDEYMKMLNAMEERDKLKSIDAKLDNNAKPTVNLKPEVWKLARSKSEKLGLGPVPLGLRNVDLRGKVGEYELQNPEHSGTHDGQEHDGEYQQPSPYEVTGSGAELGYDAIFYDMDSVGTGIVGTGIVGTGDVGHDDEDPPLDI